MSQDKIPQDLFSSGKKEHLCTKTAANNPHPTPCFGVWVFIFNLTRNPYDELFMHYQ